MLTRPALGVRSWLTRLDPFDVATVLLLAAIAVLVALTFRDYSISNDEQVQHRYGELIVAYYRSGLTDRTLFHFGNLYLYGGLFDIAAVLAGHILAADVYTIRHLLCAAIGIGGIAATAATARMIAGSRAGFLAALALTVCGVWYGAMFNHTKDVPFAAAMIGATYFLLRAARGLPRPRMRELVLFGLLMGAALGQRALGLLLLTYVPAVIALHAPRPFVAATSGRFIGRSLVLFVPAFALAYLVMIAAWPWAATAPFNPVRAIFAFAHFRYPIRTVLDGQVYLMADTPRLYVPIYLAIKLPLMLWAGAGLALATLRSANTGADSRRMRETAFMALVAIVPVVCQIVGRGPAFTGMRHFIFVVPPLAVLAGIGFDGALALLRRQRRAFASAGHVVVAAAFLWSAGALVRLHPYEYLTFNETVGGLAGASGRYATDYWVNSMHDAVVMLEQWLDREGDTGSHFVAVCGERFSFEHEAAARHRLKWATDADRADFFIAPTHMGCDRALGGTVVIRIERLGVLVAVVKDLRTRN